jgi:hypothetical protein
VTGPADGRKSLLAGGVVTDSRGVTTRALTPRTAEPSEVDVGNEAAPAAGRRVERQVDGSGRGRGSKRHSFRTTRLVSWVSTRSRGYTPGSVRGS